jgi:hypothetical protein
MDGMLCSNYRVAESVKIGVVKSSEAVGEKSPLIDGELPVLVHIGNVAQRGNPVVSIVRLKPLDCCNMCGVETLTPAATV